MDTPTRARPRRARRLGAKTLLVVGCVVLLLANVTVWLRLTALDTDRFVAALTPLADDRDLDEGLAVALTDRIMSRVDVEAQIEEALPNDNPLVVATVTRLARGLVQDTLRDVLESDTFSTIWTEALRRTHRRALQVIDGADGSIALQLTDVLERADRLLTDRWLDIIDSRTIEEIDRVVVATSDDIQTVGQAVDTLRTLAVVLPIVTLVLLALAVVLAVDRRRMVVLVGLGMVATMVVTAVALRIGRRALFDQIDGDVRRRAAGDVWTGLLTPLFRQTAVLLVLGLLLAIGAWLVGPASSTVRLPQLAAIGPYRRPLQVAVVAAAAAALLLLPSLTVTTALVVVLLAVLAVVALEIVNPDESGSGAAPA
ncbi:MAG TPA: hypothetical protein VK611_05125 [Acidimicrobiales bacterium]|nr:hypothetical protein [Acidimicrobiales bacterium]